MSEMIQNAIKRASASSATSTAKPSADEIGKVPTTPPDGIVPESAKPAQPSATPAKKIDKEEKKPETASVVPDDKERLSSLLSILDSKEPEEPSEEIPSDDPPAKSDTDGHEEELGEKGHKALAAMRVKNKELEAENARLRAGDDRKELEEKIQEYETVIQKIQYQKSAKFAKEYRDPLRNAVIEAEEIAKEFGVRPEFVKSTIGMPLAKMLEVLKKAVPDSDARSIMLESLKKCTVLARKADEAIANAKTQYKSAMEEEEASITENLNKTRTELFEKTMSELAADESVGFVLERFKGDTEDVKKWNAIVDEREARAKAILFSSDAAQQVKYMVRGAIADDLVGMAKKWQQRATNAEKRLADIMKRKPGVGAAGGDGSAGTGGQQTLKDLAKGVASKLGTRRT